MRLDVAVDQTSNSLHFDFCMQRMYLDCAGILHSGQPLLCVRVLSERGLVL